MFGSVLLRLLHKSPARGLDSHLQFGLTPAQLPTRPTKTTDSRARKFMQRYGTGSVELDAIPPAILRSLVRDSIERHMDPDRLRVLKLAEEEERDVLRSVWGGAP